MQNDDDYIIKQNFSEMFNKYFNDEESHTDLRDLCSLFSLDFGTLETTTRQEISQRFEEEQLQVLTMISQIEQLQLAPEDYSYYKPRFVLLCQKLHRSRVFFQAFLDLVDLGRCRLQNFDCELWKFIGTQNSLKSDDLSSFQTILTYLLSVGAQRGYRKYRQNMMQPIYTADGIPTGAWKIACTFEEFVAQITTDKDFNNGMWYHLTKDKSNYMGAVEYLKIANDREIPWLKPNRHVFSCQNGMYIADKDKFILYRDFLSEFHNNIKEIPVACNFFDVEVDPRIIDCIDPMDIPTEAFQQIIDYQELKKNVQEIIYGICGRGLYDVGELDDWQVMLFIKGLANTGKSCILEQLGYIYDKEDCGIISNKIEGQFGLGQVAEAFIALADDLRENFQLDQSEFQNALSGNTMSLAVKYKAAKKTCWKCPIFASGNVVPNYHDNAGSFGRRVLTVEFTKLVERQDSSLSTRMRSQIMYFIIKSNRIYHKLLEQCGQGGIWSMKNLPKEFIEHRDELTASSNVLINFLASGELEFGDDKYMPTKDFKDLLFKHARESGFKIPKWSKDYYYGPLKSRNIIIERKHLLYNNNRINGFFAIGCDRKKDDVMVDVAVNEDILTARTHDIANFLYLTEPEQTN